MRRKKAVVIDSNESGARQQQQQWVRVAYVPGRNVPVPTSLAVCAVATKQAAGSIVRSAVVPDRPSHGKCVAGIEPSASAQ